MFKMCRDFRTAKEEVELEDEMTRALLKNILMIREAFS